MSFQEGVSSAGSAGSPGDPASIVAYALEHSARTVRHTDPISRGVCTMCHRRKLKIIIRPPKVPRNVTRRSIHGLVMRSLDVLTREVLRNTFELQGRATMDHDTGRSQLAPLNCGFCSRLPFEPITAPCGHTNCKACLRGHLTCFCGAVLPSTMHINILVQKLLKTLEDPLPPLPPQAPPEDRSESTGTESENMNRIFDRLSTDIVIIQLPVPMPKQDGDKITLTPAVVSSVVARRWLKDQELDCHVCTQAYYRPVTTPCGHTFCRACLDRALDHNEMCPMCKTPLRWFEMDPVQETQFVKESLKFAGIVHMPPAFDDDLLPIFMCTIAFPMVSCPLFVFEPRYRLMLRRVLRKDRLFGMCHPLQHRAPGIQIGTKLEIRDCVRLPNGCSLVSTMGVGRFYIVEDGERDGYNVARTVPLKDNTKCDTDFYRRLRPLFWEWQDKTDPEDNAAMDLTFGPMPKETSGTTEDGPAFLWWLLALLPFSFQIKYSILKSEDAIKRVSALELLFIELLKTNDRHSLPNMDQMGPIPPLSPAP